MNFVVNIAVCSTCSVVADVISQQIEICYLGHLASDRVEISACPSRRYLFLRRRQSLQQQQQQQEQQQTQSSSDHSNGGIASSEPCDGFGNALKAEVKISICLLNTHTYTHVTTQHRRAM
jgi:hypothetical protein